MVSPCEYIFLDFTTTSFSSIVLSSTMMSCVPDRLGIFMVAGEISILDAFSNKLSHSQCAVMLNLPFSSVKADERNCFGELAGEIITLAKSTPFPCVRFLQPRKSQPVQGSEKQTTAQ